MVVVGVVFVAGVVVVVDVSVAVVVSVTASSDVVSGAFADATTVRATASVGSATAFVVVDALETVAGVFTVVASTAGSSAVSAALPNTFFFFNGLIIRSFLCADFCGKINRYN